MRGDTPSKTVPLLLLLFAGTALSGCLSWIPASSTTVDIPAPSPGSRYEYQGDSGSQLTVQVAGVSQRYDALMRVHPVVRLNVTYQPPDTSTTFDFALNAGRAQGRVVQQVAGCEATTDENDSTVCGDERAVVYWGPGGLPGGLGAGPFWGQTLRAGDVPVDTTWIRDPGLELTYSFEAVDRERGTCLEGTSRPTVPAHEIHGLFLTVANGPLVLCSGIPLPVQFETPGGRSYRLVDSDRRGDPVALEEGNGWTERGSPLEKRAVEAPLLVNDRSMGDAFPVREAHRYALNNSARYRAIFDAPGATVTWTLFASDPDPGMTNLTGSTEWTRDVAVTHPDKGTHLVRVEKRSYDTELRPPEYEIEKEEERSWVHSASSQGFAGNQAKASAVRQRLQAIIQQPVDESLQLTIWPTWIRTHWMPDDRSRLGHIRPDGFYVRIWFEDPEEDPPAMVSFPYDGTVDGPTGALLWAEVHPDRLPLEEPPAS